MSSMTEVNSITQVLTVSQAVSKGHPRPNENPDVANSAYFLNA